jgi:serpin B
LEIPYKSQDLSMIIFLPNDRSGLAGLEQSLTDTNAQQWLSHLLPATKVIVTIPKFKMTQQFELGATLSAMGMPQAFAGSADFSGMTGKRDFAISEVIHKAYVDVNEEGTEAAAATGITMRTMAMRPVELAPPVFRADHPFVFIIRDNRSASMLFMGRVADPKN